MNDLILAKQDIVVRRDLRQKIINLEHTMFDLADAITDFEHLMTHRFIDGIYAREINIPKGMLIVAKIHKTEHLSIISKGEVSVLTEFGREHWVAPVTFVSRRWTKRVVYAHEDTIWTVFHPTQKQTPQEVEEDVIAKNYDELDKLELEILALE